MTTLEMQLIVTDTQYICIETVATGHVSCDMVRTPFYTGVNTGVNVMILHRC